MKPLPILDGAAVAKKAASVAIDFARAQIRETDGPNRSLQIDKIEHFWGLQGKAYCAMGALYCYAKAYLFLAGLPTTDEYIRAALWMISKRFVVTSARCTLIMENAEARHIWRAGYANIVIGELVLFEFDGDPADAEHIGIFLSYVHDEKLGLCVKCVEFNTSSGKKGSQDDGDGVFIRLRPVRLVKGSVSLH